MIGEFKAPERDFGCAAVIELVHASQRVGIVWQSKTGDATHHWAVGDGSRYCGYAESIDAAKSALLGVEI